MKESPVKKLAGPERGFPSSAVRLKSMNDNGGSDGGYAARWQPMAENSWASLAIVMIWETNSGSPRKSDLEYLDECKGLLAEKGVPISKRSKALNLIRPVVDEKLGGRFGVTQAAHIIKSVAECAMGDEELDFRGRVLRSWCQGNLDLLMKEELRSVKNLPLSREEKDAVGSMFEAATACERIVAGVGSEDSYLKGYAEIGKLNAVLTMRIYHPLASDDVRKDQIVRCLTILEEAMNRLTAATA